MADPRPFTDHLRTRSQLAAMPREELAQLAKDSQATADWLQSQAAEAQRLAAKLRRALRGKGVAGA